MIAAWYRRRTAKLREARQEFLKALYEHELMAVAVERAGKLADAELHMYGDNEEMALGRLRISYQKTKDRALHGEMHKHLIGQLAIYAELERRSSVD